MKKILVAILAAAMTISLAGAVYAEDPAPESSSGMEMKKEETKKEETGKKKAKKKHVKKKKAKKTKKATKKMEGHPEGHPEEGVK